jgi:hypothetical protein
VKLKRKNPSFKFVSFLVFAIITFKTPVMSHGDQYNIFKQCTVSFFVFFLWTAVQSAKRKLHQRWPLLNFDLKVLDGLISFPPVLKPSILIINNR